VGKEHFLIGDAHVFSHREGVAFRKQRIPMDPFGRSRLGREDAGRGKSPEDAFSFIAEVLTAIA